MDAADAPLARQRDWYEDYGRYGLGIASLVLANASVLVYFIVYDLTLYQLVLVFWCECLWIGLASAAKLLIASLFGSPYENRSIEVSPGAALFLSILLLGLVSGAFLSLCGLLLTLILFVGRELSLAEVPGPSLEDFVVILGASVLLAGGHAVSFVVNFLVLGEFRTAGFKSLIALPFRRSFALLVTIFASLAVIGMVPELATTVGFSAVVIIVKLVMDLRSHVGERRSLAAA